MSGIRRRFFNHDWYCALQAVLRLVNAARLLVLNIWCQFGCGPPFCVRALLVNLSPANATLFDGRTTVDQAVFIVTHRRLERSCTRTGLILLYFGWLCWLRACLSCWKRYLD